MAKKEYPIDDETPSTANEPSVPYIPTQKTLPQSDAFVPRLDTRTEAEWAIELHTRSEARKRGEVTTLPLAEVVKEIREFVECFRG